MSEALPDKIKNFAKGTYNGIVKHDIALQGAAIAFYTIFSTAPLIIIVLAVINLFLGDQETSRVFTTYLSRIAGSNIANSLLDISKNSSSQSSGFIASIFAAGMMLFGATTVITQLKNTLNVIWEVPPTDVSSVMQYFLNRLLAVVIIIVLTALFLASLLLEGGVTFFTGLFSPYLPHIFTPFLKLASSVLSIFVTIIFFAIIFKILPDINAPWKDIFVGAVVTTFLFLIGKYLVGLYLSSTSMYTAYKTAGSFIIFLIWIYYNVQVVLIGAEFTHVYTRRFGEDPLPTKNAEIIDWTKIM